MSQAKVQSGPHARIPTADSREAFLARLLDRLWSNYRNKVPAVRQYEQVVRDCGGDFVNDHIAFRTLASQSPTTGIVSVARLFEALGYVPAGCYHFPDKSLSAIHFQHPNELFPKLFISELQSWRLDDVPRSILQRSLSTHDPALPDQMLRDLWSSAAPEDENLLNSCAEAIETVPWNPVEFEDLTAVNQASQYAAWVLVHGYNVNHFTALVNAHGVPELSDLDRTVAALRAAGVPMKSEIEGTPGSKLRQTATTAATANVTVLKQGQPVVVPWSYAYFELAERGTVIDPETGNTLRFEGFLGPQATQLFEMTRIST